MKWTVMVTVTVMVHGSASADVVVNDPMTSTRAKLTTGRVVQKDGALEMTLSDQDPGCAMAGAPHNPRLIVTLEPGPNATFYAGHKAGADMMIAMGDNGTGLEPQGVAITLAPVKLTAGSHVTGSIDMMYASGTFDAILCPNIDPAKLRALPAKAAAAPFSGTIKGTPFVVKSALVMAMTDTIHSVLLYGTAGVTCKTKSSATGPTISLTSIGGASSAANLTGSPQPARASLVKPDTYWDHAAWVQLDKLVFTSGTITGRAVLDSADAKLSGTFTATVCGP